MFVRTPQARQPSILSANRGDVAKRTITQVSRTRATPKSVASRFDLLSAPPPRSRRLGGESHPRKSHRRGAEAAKVAQRKAEIQTLGKSIDARAFSSRPMRLTITKHASKLEFDHPETEIARQKLRASLRPFARRTRALRKPCHITFSIRCKHSPRQRA